MVLASRLSQRQIFFSMVLNLQTFSKLSLCMLCLSIILMSRKMKKKNLFSFISVTPPPNLTLWVFSHLNKQYVLLLYSPHAIISVSYLSPCLSVTITPAFTSIPYPPAA